MRRVRALRGIALGHKSWLFASSDRGGERAAVMFTLIPTVKLDNVDPWLGLPTCSQAWRAPHHRHCPMPKIGNDCFQIAAQ